MFLDVSGLKGQFPIKVDKQLLHRSPDTDVLAVRYGFRPDSLSSETPLLLEKDKSDYVLSSQAKNPSEQYVFRGNLSKAKDVECILLFDPATKTFKLTPLNYTLRVNPSREKSRKQQIATTATANSSNNNGSPLATPVATPVGTPLQSAAASPVKKTKVHAPGLSSNSGGSTTKTKPNSKISTSVERALSPRTSQASVTKKSATAKKSTAKSVAKTATTKAIPHQSSANTSSKSNGNGNSNSNGNGMPRRASKHVPSSTSIVQASSGDEPQAEDSDDEDLLGALANELEESLEDESNSSSKYGASLLDNRDTESDVSDADDDFEAKPNAKPTSNGANGRHSAYSSPAPGQLNGPMSLRGLAKGSSFSKDEDELSSSEEE